MTVKLRPNKAKKSVKPPSGLLLYRWLIQSSAKLSVSLATSLAYKLWFRSPKFQEPEREKRWRLQSEQIRVDHPICPIAVYRWGDKGPKILLVHGWSGRGTQLGAIATALAEAGFQAYAFDAPGHGLSPGRSSTIFEIEDVVHSLNQSFGPFQAIIAHSFGVMVAALAIRNGMRINGLVTISSPTSMEYLFKRFSQAMRLPDPVTTAVRDKLLAQFGRDLWQRVSVSHNLAKLALPVLLLHDEQDTDVPWTLSKQLSEELPYATLSVSQGLGHRRILRSPEVINTLLAFISKL